MTSTDNSIGFVCGTKGDSVSFLVNKGVALSFGQIVRIDSGERSFYARVVNSESSSTLETIEQLREAQGKEAFGPYSAYRSVDAEALVAIRRAVSLFGLHLRRQRPPEHLPRRHLPSRYLGYALGRPEPHGLPLRIHHR